MGSFIAYKNPPREIYLEGKERTLEEFQSALKEVQRDEPSVGGKIAGMDFRQFSALQVFNIIVEQEQCVTGRFKDEPYIDQKEEKKILKQMIKDAKKVFGDAYDEWYQNAKKNK
jgi:hypothetical protein